MQPMLLPGPAVRPCGALLVVAALASACASPGTSDGDVSTEPPAPDVATSAVPDELDAVTGSLIINRQRDLIDRGLINVQLVNDSHAVIEMTDRQLVAEHFVTDPAEPRVSPIPNGRPINLQVPYGTAVDCTDPEAVGARLEFTYTADGDPAERTASVDLGGTEILDGIRDEQCAQARFDDLTDTAFGAPIVDGEQVSVDLSVRSAADAPPIEILGGYGTILVGAELPGAPIALGGPETIVPVVFDVNRCDPHAMAEVTKRYGLELSVAVDGATPLPIDVDVAPVQPALEAIVANCQERAGTEL